METGISRRNQDVTVPTRVFNMLNMCMHVSSVRRDRAQTAQSTHIVDKLTMCSAISFRMHVRADSI